MLRKKCRTQSLWNLHLAGDWHVASETMPPRARPHMMRCMLISNLAVDQRFANGTQAFGSRSDRTGRSWTGPDGLDISGPPAAVAPGGDRLQEESVASILPGPAGKVLQRDVIVQS